MGGLSNERAWVQATKLISEKYGKNLRYKTLKLVSVSDMSEKNISLFFTKGSDLVIPLQVKNYSLGDVIVDDGSVLSYEQQAEIAELVKFIVEPALYNEKLKQAEAETEIKFSLSPHLKIVDESDASVVRLYKSPEPQNKLLSNHIALKSHTEMTRHKVALKIHEMAGRTLFIQLEDIMASIKSMADLFSMHDVSIYIKDVMTLPEKQMSWLEDVFAEASQHIQAGPLFLIGTSLSEKNIEISPLQSNTKKEMLGFLFDIDRVPISQQTSEDILDLLFFQFDQNEM
jgi:hypothetical protein